MIAIILIILIGYAVYLSSRPKRVNSGAYAPAPRPSAEHRLRAENSAWLDSMKKRYPIEVDSNGQRVIRAQGKRNTVSYQVQDGESEMAAYEGFEKMVSLIKQEQNIYGEF